MNCVASKIIFIKHIKRREDYSRFELFTQAMLALVTNVATDEQGTAIKCIVRRKNAILMT